MQLVKELAIKIINEVKRVMTENIIVVDRDGEIIASTDPSRVGVIHEGAQLVLRTKKKLYITDEMAYTLKGVRPGINLPIIYESDVIGVIGITGVPEKVEPFAELIRRMTELIIKEANYIEKKEWATRGLESFCYEWIYADEVSEDLVNRGQILGISFDSSYQCILFQVEGTFRPDVLQQTDMNMYLWFKNQFQRDKNDLFIRWGNGRFILLKSSNNQIPSSTLFYELTRWLDFFQNQYGINLSIGIGNRADYESISISYIEAQKALKVALKGEGIVCYESLLLDIVLEEVNDKTQQEFITRVLSTIQHDTELIETLSSYLKNNQSLKNTAIDLHIHINTLHYRLKQLKETTGIDPRSSEGITLFYIALSFLSDKHTKKPFSKRSLLYDYL